MGFFNFFGNGNNPDSNSAYDRVSSRAKLSQSYEKSVKECEQQIEKLKRRGQDTTWFQEHKAMCDRKAQELMHEAHVEMDRETIETSYYDTINDAINSQDFGDYYQ
jgi:hypothetical protein